MTAQIERVITEYAFPSLIDTDPDQYLELVEAHAQRLQRIGVTHLIINSTAISLPWVMDPENSYLRFTTYGHTLDKYVTSTYNEGLYHASVLELNRNLLLQQAKLAKKYGLRCVFRCVEPILMPESFFRRYPALRGPRVDNPICSTTPYYALCPTLPEVQDHYQQMMRKMLALVPEIDELHIFTNDSGAGFCYSNHLYAGPNGPGHCKHIPAAKQAQIFVKTLLDAAHAVNPDFRVVMTSGLTPQEKSAYLQDSVPGMASSVYSAFAWMAGLEDCWVSVAIGPEAREDQQRMQEGRTWRDADYAARIRQVHEHGGQVYASYTFDYYMGDEPRPYQTHEVMTQLLKWGVTNIIGGGPGITPYSANTAIIRRTMNGELLATEQAVAELATDWVGVELAPSLCAIWKLIDQAARLRPMPPNGYSLIVMPLINDMPIVPDESRLTDDALGYFFTPVQRDEQRMKAHQGGVWRVLHYQPNDKAAYLRQYEQQYFPLYDQALAALEQLLLRDDMSEAQRACLDEQRGVIADKYCEQRSIYHWIMASCLCIDDAAQPAVSLTLPEIIAQEIALFDNKARAKGLARDDSPRITLMRQHLHDAPHKVDLSEFAYHTHPGLTGWDGAHEIAEG
ncbi:MAG TPA: hypothetical protein VGL77_17720 [Armatimonadota bacterium]|jgi:hypothetical protein